MLSAVSILILLTSQLNVIDLGATGDGITDDSLAFEQAVALAGVDGNSTAIYVPAARVWYRLSRPLRVAKHIKLYGDTGGGWNAKSILRFDRCTSGLLIARSGGWSTVEDIALFGQHGNGCFTTGIKVEGASVKIRSVRVTDFAGNGLEFDCDINRGTDCSLARLENVRSETNGGWGLYTNGGDANAILTLGFDAADNGLGCMRLDDFLGGVHIGGHCNQAEIPSSVAIQTGDPNARHTFIGQYVEGSKLVTVNTPSLYIGGIGGRRVGTAGEIANGAINNLRFNDTLEMTAKEPGAVLMQMDNYRFPSSWMLEFIYEMNEARYYQWAWAKSQVGMQIADHGADIPPGMVLFPQGLWMGRAGSRNHLTFGSGPPNRGVWKIGDIILLNVDGECAFLRATRGGNAESTDPTLQPIWKCAKLVP